LLCGFRGINRLMSPEYLHHTELLVCDAHNPDVSFVREHGFYPLYMYICILLTTTMPQIDAELEHGKTVHEHILSEPCIVLPVLFCFSWKIK